MALLAKRRSRLKGFRQEVLDGDRFAASVSLLCGFSYQ